MAAKKLSPFAVDDEDNEEQIAEAKEKVKEKIREEAISTKRESADDDRDVEVSVEPEEEEEEEREPSRKERRKNRFTEANARAEAAEARARQLEQENQRAWQLLQRQPQQQPQTPEKDPLDDELEQIYREHELTLNEYNQKSRDGQLTPELERHYWNKAKDIEQRKIENRARKLLRKENIRPSDPNEAVRVMLNRRYADVLQIPGAKDWAQGYFVQQRALGRPDTEDLLDESMAAARRQFGIQNGRRPSPDQATRQRYTGVPVGGGANGSGESSQKIVMTAPLRKLARLAYPKLSEREAYEKWAKGAGRRMLEEQKKRNA